MTLETTGRGAFRAEIKAMTLELFAAEKKYLRGYK
jgi:hypothetical protein